MALSRTASASFFHSKRESSRCLPTRTSILLKRVAAAGSPTAERRRRRRKSALTSARTCGWAWAANRAEVRAFSTCSMTARVVGPEARMSSSVMQWRTMRVQAVSTARRRAGVVAEARRESVEGKMVLRRSRAAVESVLQSVECQRRYSSERLGFGEKGTHLA